MDVGLTEACNLALCALVGRLAYKEKCKQSVDAWISIHWKPILGYITKIHLLQQGWIGFIFNKPEDSTLILDGSGRSMRVVSCSKDGGSVLILQLSSSVTGMSGSCYLGSPYNSGTTKLLNLLGLLRAFFKSGCKLSSRTDRRMAKIYVEIDIQAGLPEVLEIDWRNQLITQRLDFLGIPFRCSYCRRTGHLRRDCHKFPRPDIDLDPAEEPNFDGYISSPNQFAEQLAPNFGQDSNPPDDSLVGKIQLLCPSLYNTFSSWDRLYIANQENLILGSGAKATVSVLSDHTSLPP
jgi:hypothetical protein